MARDIPFQLTKSNFRQTALNAAVAAGFAADADEVIAVAEKFYTEFLEPQVDADNEKLRADFEAGAASKAAGKTSTSGKPDDEFTWGKYAGKTIEQVYQEDPGYIDWLINKDKQPARNTMRERARSYVDGLKAGVS